MTVVSPALFPAYAGVIPGTGEEQSKARSFPRLRGGDPFCGPHPALHSVFSPPTRG